MDSVLDLVEEPPSTGAGASDLNLGFTDSDDRDVVAANRELFVSAATEGKEILGLVTLRQIHSSLIRRVSGEGRGPERNAGGA